MRNIVLGREEVYKASSQVWSFRNVDDIVNGINLRFSNMAGGFPFESSGHRFTSSECLYLCGEWSDNTEEHRMIQDFLMQMASGYACNRYGKAIFRKQVREDFPTFRLQWMLFCVWQKCKGNADFRQLLLSTGDAILVEDTTTDKWSSAEIWGCRNWELANKRLNLETVLMHHHKDLKRKDLKLLINVETNKINDIGVWKGQNNIGKILMLCRDCIREGIEPQIDYDLLRRSNIYILGDLLTFENC